MPWNWRDTRHQVEALADARYARLRVGDDEITRAVAGAADRITAARVVAQMQREGRVPLEIKGLKSNMLKVAQRIESLNAKSAKFDEIGAGVEQGLDDIIAQVSGHGDDITFAATVLGNSTSEEGKKG